MGLKTELPLLIRRLPWGLVVLVVLSIGLAQLTLQANPAVASPDLDPALEQAVRAAIIAEQPNVASDYITVSPIARVEAWVFGSAGFILQPSSTAGANEEVFPQILLFFAEQRAGGWNVAIEHTAAFLEALTRIPRNLLTPEQWMTMPTASAMPASGGGDGSTWLNLPWAIGETWRLTGGPHPALRGTPWSALDFSGGSGIVRAAREGTAYTTPCPNGGSPDYVRIDHVGNFSTNYYHLANLAVSNGSWVNRYSEIGRISNNSRCWGGYSTGPHVHFWISRPSGSPRSAVPIHDIVIGGWRVQNGSKEYDGCMVRISNGDRRCVVYGSNGMPIGGYPPIYNDGTVGVGNIPPNPPILDSPADGVTVRTPQVTLQVSDGGDPDNGPHPMRSFFFRIVKDDNSWMAESGWIDNRQPPVSWTVELPSEGTYKWWVLAGDWANDSVPAGPRTLYYRRNVPPNPPILVGPAHDVIVLTPQVTLQVADGGDPDNGPHPTRNFFFRIVKDDNSWKAESGWIDNTSWTVELPSEGTYTWWAWAGDRANESAPAGPRTVRYRRNVPPNPPILITPVHDAIVRTARVTLQVADGGDPDNWPRPTRTFLFRIAKEDNSWSAESGWTSSTSWTVDLPSGGVYKWWAHAGDGPDQTASRPRTLHYRPNVAPNPPTFVGPADNDTVLAPRVTLQVADGGDPDDWPNSARRFLFRIAKEDNSWIAESGWTDSTSWTVDLPSEGVYQWWVRANDGAVDSSTVGPRTVRYRRNVPPNPPTFVGPADNATVRTARVALQAADGGDPDDWPSPAREFLFRIAKEDNSWSAESGWIGSASWTVELPSEGVYKWWVRVRDGADEAATNAPRTLNYIIRFAISGRVLDSRAVPVAGVTVSDGTRSATTDANGVYTLADVPAGTYTLTPSRNGYAFTPRSRTVTVSGDVNGIDFTGVRMVYLPLVQIR